MKDRFRCRKSKPFLCSYSSIQWEAGLVWSPTKVLWNRKHRFGAQWVHGFLERLARYVGLPNRSTSRCSFLWTSWNFSCSVSCIWPNAQYLHSTNNVKTITDSLAAFQRATKLHPNELIKPKDANLLCDIGKLNHPNYWLCLCCVYTE